MSASEPNANDDPNDQRPVTEPDHEETQAPPSVKSKGSDSEPVPRFTAEELDQMRQNPITLGEVIRELEDLSR